MDVEPQGENRLAQFLVATRKACDGSQVAKWSNRYFLEADNIDAALTAASGIWTAAEVLIHDHRVYCYEIYANLVGDAPFTPGTIRAIPAPSQRGSVSSGARGEELPLFNVVRCDFPVVNSRPSRKFYRCLLRTGDIDDGNLNITHAARVDQMLQAIASFGNIVDVDGQGWVGQGVQRGITARRLGREAALGVPAGPPLG
jgi:hypothetical protein